MFLEILSAILFMVALIFLWIPLSIVWGICVFVFRIVVNTTISLADDDYEAIEFIYDVVGAGASGIGALIDIPAWMWNWANFHP